MAYNANGEWVDDPSSKPLGQMFFPNAAQAWNDGAGLADASFQRGDTMEGWGRQAARVGGTLAGLSHDINPVNKVANWMSQTPAQPGYMKGAVNVGPGVDRRTGQSTWVDSRGAAPEINGQGGYRKMASDLADLSQQRFGGQSADPYGATPDRFSQLDLGNQFMTGSAPGQIPLGREGGFFSGNRAYNVNDTNQTGVSRVTSKGASPLYTNVAPEDGVAGLKNQMIGGEAADVQQGLDRFARANATWQSVIDKQPLGGYNELADPNAAWNARMDRQSLTDDMSWQMKGARTPEERAMIGKLYDQQIAKETQHRGQDMQYRSHMAGIDTQGQNQRELASIQGRNQLEVEGLRGRNQEQRDQRAYSQALDVEAMKQSNPYYASAAKENEAKSRLYGVQADQAEREASYGKTPQAQYMKQLDILGKGAQAGDPVATKMYQEALARLAFFNKKNGYADGGKVDPEELMRQMSAKYGAPVASQPAPQPVQQPRPVQQPQQPAPQGGLMDRMRAAATGNLEQRMRAAGAYAEGGPIGVGGRQVLGEGDGKSDSLPAVIDGEHPAALSTGEFVMPIEAVQHFGLAKLNKMVEQARKGLDTGR